MAMYYGDSNGKAQEIVVVGKQGPAGPQGPQGEPGPQGPAGQGVPSGGKKGQVLTHGETIPVWDNIPGFSTSVEGTNIRYYTNGRGIWVAGTKLPATKIELTNSGNTVFNQPLYTGTYSETIPEGVDTLPNTTRAVLSSYIYPYKNGIVWINAEIDSGSIIITIYSIGVNETITVPVFKTLLMWTT